MFSPLERLALLGGEARCAPGPRHLPTDDVDAALAFDLNVYLPEDLLVKMDVAAMRWGLEGRCPLLDTRPCGAGDSPRASLKQTQREGKQLFRAAIGDLIPREIPERPKRGFGSPIAQWMSGPLRSMVGDPIADRSASHSGVGSMAAK